MKANKKNKQAAVSARLVEPPQPELLVTLHVYTPHNSWCECGTYIA